MYWYSNEWVPVVVSEIFPRKPSTVARSGTRYLPTGWQLQSQSCRGCRTPLLLARWEWGGRENQSDATLGVLDTVRVSDAWTGQGRDHEMTAERLR